MHGFGIAFTSLILGHILLLQIIMYIINIRSRSSCTVIVIVLCPFCQSRFKFPAIFVVYEMIPLGLFNVFVLIGHMDRTNLFCSSQNLVESIADSTAFCSLQGLLYL